MSGTIVAGGFTSTALGRVLTESPPPVTALPPGSVTDAREERHGLFYHVAVAERVAPRRARQGQGGIGEMQELGDADGLLRDERRRELRRHAERLEQVVEDCADPRLPGG